jgi:hypothetical protein
MERADIHLERCPSCLSTSSATAPMRDGLAATGRGQPPSVSAHSAFDSFRHATEADGSHCASAEPPPAATTAALLRRQHAYDDTYPPTLSAPWIANCDTHVSVTFAPLSKEETKQSAQSSEKLTTLRQERKIQQTYLVRRREPPVPGAVLPLKHPPVPKGPGHPPVQAERLYVCRDAH